MKCTNKEQETCESEKRGCEGCYYNNDIEKDVNIHHNDKEKTSFGEIIDNLLENPAIMIKQFSKMLEDYKNVNEELQIKLKNKQSEIDYLKGKISVYEELFNKKRCKDE